MVHSIFRKAGVGAPHGTTPYTYKMERKPRQPPHSTSATTNATAARCHHHLMSLSVPARVTGTKTVWCLAYTENFITVSVLKRVSLNFFLLPCWLPAPQMFSIYYRIKSILLYYIVLQCSSSFFLLFLFLFFISVWLGLVYGMVELTVLSALYTPLTLLYIWNTSKHASKQAYVQAETPLVRYLNTTYHHHNGL